MANLKGTPKDAQVMASILKDMGVMEYEPRVLNQMLEFAYRYVTCILDDAQLYSSHAKKKCLDIDDVRLAIQLQMDKYFTTPPPRELLLEIARQKNCTPLPLIKATAGLRLPPDRYSLTACNYHLKSASRKQRTAPSSSRISLSSLQTGSSGKINPAINISSKTGAALSVVTKAVASPTVAIVSRTNNITTAIPKTAPTPIIKFSDGNKSNIASGPSSSVITTTESVSASEVLIPPASLVNTELSSASENSNKRKREDEPDDYDI